MNQRRIERLAAADVDAETFRSLAAHGEDLTVERKSKLPEPEPLGAVVASMANMLGGWILLGVADKDGELGDAELPRGDLQSNMGNRLRNVLDPVPPFLAGELEIDGVRVGFIRVFEASSPILTSDGRIYTRDAGGKRPVDDHRELLELARAGRQAESDARARIETNALSARVLGLPRAMHSLMEGSMKTIVRASPLTVTPQVTEWPISRGPHIVQEQADRLASFTGPSDKAGFATLTEPFGRAVAGRARALSPKARALGLWQATAFADCAGVFGTAMSQPIANMIDTTSLRRQYIRPAIDVVANLLEKAEAYGDAVWELHLFPARDVYLANPRGRFEDHQVPDEVRCGSAVLTIPADEDARVELGRRWEREVARGARLPVWELGEE